MQTPPEPPRQTSLDLLEPAVKICVEKLLVWMEQHGKDPLVFETLRTHARQEWLYGVGRKYDLDRKPVTWTLHSLHLPGLDGRGHAADIISKHHGWDDPLFFTLLKQGANACGLETIPVEQCHVQKS